MSLQSYTVSYAATKALVASNSFTALSNVQNIGIFMGRHSQLDQYRASTASVTLRYPTGYASPVTALVSGTYIRIANSTSGQYLFQGRISDVSVKYGIPYASGIGNADYVDLTIEGTFAELGRVQGNGYSMAAGTLNEQYDTASTQTGVTVGYVNTGTSNAMAATTLNGTWGDWVASTALTVNGRMSDAEATGTPNIKVFSPFYRVAMVYNFSDTANNATNQVYDQINFDSLADNYYTQVVVDPESYGEQTVTAAGATIPYRTYRVNTLNSSAAQGTDYANYLLANYGTAKFAISSVSCSGEAQTSFKLDKSTSGSGEFNWSNAIGATVSITFRGTVYPSIIEGLQMSATPAGSRYTFYVSGADLNSYLVLDDAVFGKLDYNKLGY